MPEVIKMGRTPKFENSVVVSLRLPQKFVDSKPEEIEMGDWLRKSILNHAALPTSQKSITAEQKNALKVFVAFFGSLAESGIIGKQVTPDVLEAADKLEAMSNE